MVKNVLFTCRNLLASVKNSLLFSFPLVLFQILNTISSYSVAMIIAHLGTRFSAAYSIINSVIMSTNIFFFGILSAISIFISYELGSKTYKNIQDIFNTSIYLSLLLTICNIILYLLFPKCLEMLSQPVDIVVIVRDYFAIASFGILPYFGGIFLLQILMAIKKTNISFYTNVIRFFLTLSFVFILCSGLAGIKSLGISGASIATVIVNWIMLPILLYFVISSNLMIKASKIFSKLNFNAFFKIIRIGIPIGFTLIIELILHLLNSIFAGQINIIQQAIYSLFLQSLVAIVVIPFAMCQCTSVSIANVCGSTNSIQAIKNILIADLIVALLIVTIISGFLLLISNHIAHIFFPDLIFMSSKDKHDITIVFRLTSIFLIIETIRLIVAAGLRGMQDVNFSLISNIISFLIIGAFLSKFLAFNYGFNSKGLILGELMAVVCSTCLLSLRLLYVIKRKKESEYMAYRTDEGICR